MEYKSIPLLRYSSLVVLLFLAISTQADALEPNYDFAAQQIKTYDIRSPLVLSCNGASKSSVLSWYKEDQEISKVESLKDRYTIKAHQFIIDRTNENDDGKYTCKADDKSADINVIANPAVKLPSSSAVVEGEKLSIQCIVVGTSPTLEWKIGTGNSSETLEPSDRFKLEPDSNGIANAILTIEDAKLDDRNTYTCIASNKASDLQDKVVSDDTYLRVKGKLAALWPFLGICAEVFVLCAIILIYEKRRNRADPEESDTDQSPEHEKLNK